MAEKQQICKKGRWLEPASLLSCFQGVCEQILAFERRCGIRWHLAGDVKSKRSRCPDGKSSGRGVASALWARRPDGKSDRRGPPLLLGSAARCKHHRHSAVSPLKQKRGRAGARRLAAICCARRQCPTATGRLPVSRNFGSSSAHANICQWSVVCSSLSGSTGCAACLPLQKNRRLGR